MGAATELGPAPPAPAAPAGTRRTRIGIFPAGARSSRRRLFAALEEAYPVSFEGLGDAAGEVSGGAPAAANGAGGNHVGIRAGAVAGGERNGARWAGGLDGLLAIGPDTPFDAPAELPYLHAVGEELSEEGPGGDVRAEVALAAHPALAPPLRGARLTDRRCGPLPADALAPGQLTLASVGGAPAWVASGANHAHELLAAAPAELAAGESLRERLAPGRCLALLALVRFIQSLSAQQPSEATPPQAAFVLDDPNLHWPSYGHLRYEQLALHARVHGYHMAIAMAPLDGWFAHPRVVRLFMEHPGQLSLCVHGNDHLGPELGRIASDAEGLALARQALARAAAFQRRTGLPVERVMVPPHEQLNEPAARGLLAGGFEAVCVSRPYPWIAPRSPTPAAALGTGPPECGALAGWDRRELVAGGLPLLLRAGFNAPREDLVLRAFLGQPLILYGHHDLLADGLDVLAEAAAAIDTLGAVRWGSLAEIARAGGAAPPPVPSISREAQVSEAQVSLRPHPRALLRRLASEARDRARVG
ncbi:MAG TPA: hypothetical protein VG147_13115 [Solirubrobacteraceae bacterium]|jgi:hypothetical protein|nr:hypothetical protein [Solirubrobacteraceae bacterium]